MRLLFLQFFGQIKLKIDSLDVSVGSVPLRKVLTIQVIFIPHCRQLKAVVSGQTAVSFVRSSRNSFVKINFPPVVIYVLITLWSRNTNYPLRGLFWSLLSVRTVLLSSWFRNAPVHDNQSSFVLFPSLCRRFLHLPPLCYFGAAAVDLRVPNY